MTARPLCTICHIRPRLTYGIKKNGQIGYKLKCSTCTKFPDLGNKAKQIQCDVCHKNHHPIQLDVDHINGNKDDNNYENYQILCANCHRLKTYMQRDFNKGTKND